MTLFAGIGLIMSEPMEPLEPATGSADNSQPVATESTEPGQPEAAESADIGQPGAAATAESADAEHSDMDAYIDDLEESINMAPVYPSVVLQPSGEEHNQVVNAVQPTPLPDREYSDISTVMMIIWRRMGPLGRTEYRSPGTLPPRLR